MMTELQKSRFQDSHNAVMEVMTEQEKKFISVKAFRVQPVGKVASDINLGIDITLKHSKGEVTFLLQPLYAKELIRSLAYALDEIK